MTSSETPIWQEPVRGFYADPGQFLALSGLDFLRSTLNGGGLPPPFSYLCGAKLTAVEPGAVTFTMPTTDWLLLPQGVVSGATLSLLVDAPLGCTVQTALPPATPWSTAEISLKYIRTVVPGSGTLTARGRLIHAGKTVAVSLVEVTDSAGRLLTVASTRCAILPSVAAPADLVERVLKNPPRPTEPAWPTPHPYQRPARGEVLPQEIWDRMSGLEVLRALIKGDLPAPPLAHLCGSRVIEAEEGRVRWKMPTSEWLCAPVKGRLYGGATAYLAGAAIDTAIQTTVPAGTAFAPVDLKVYFLRPVLPDGRDLIAEGTVIHRGRSVAVGTSQVFDADGKKVAVASGSALILPGRPATVTTELTPPHLLDDADED
ncbi:MAG TPA: PaaI family thioesterase [Vineibacter sp.]|nr:PaaI family thioesterase [Vineibacter sp.]